jgi:hypothetical protein
MSPFLTPIDAHAARCNPDPATEYPRRDALIAKLRAELADH